MPGTDSYLKREVTDLLPAAGSRKRYDYRPLVLLEYRGDSGRLLNHIIPPIFASVKSETPTHFPDARIPSLDRLPDPLVAARNDHSLSNPVSIRCLCERGEPRSRLWTRGSAEAAPPAHRLENRSYEGTETRHKHVSKPALGGLPLRSAGLPSGAVPKQGLVARSRTKTRMRDLARGRSQCHPEGNYSPPSTISCCPFPSTRIILAP